MLSTESRCLIVAGLLAALVILNPAADMPSFAEESAQAESSDATATENEASNSATAGQISKEGDDSGSTAVAKSSPKKPKYPDYSDVIDDEVETMDGVIKLHRKDEKLFAELRPGQLDKDFIVLITIARGIGQTPLVSGYSWGFGNDAVWQFRKAGERIHLVRRNVRFTAEKGSPTAKAVDLAYTDSVLFSLPITTKSAGGNYVVDLSPVFMSDLPQISMVLRGYRFAGDKSTWAAVNSFPKNVELQVAATYASGGEDDIDSVPDSRGVTVNVHYSISELPQTSYKPRLADDRVGYFLTVLKDYSKKNDDDRFVRYITRWNLEKSDADAAISPPKEPITFYLEKTIPFKYRKPIRDGILDWNKAFEKAGFYDGISVIQQRDEDIWDPGDIRFNTFRWITADVGFAMGPSRVNPLTGEILDADIILDASFLQYWKQQYETFTPAGIEIFTGGPVDIEGYRAQQRNLPAHLSQHHDGRCTCNLLGGVSHQYAFAATVMATRKRNPEDMEKLIMQGLKEVTMHEVGHTLGLRHNFKASTLHNLADMNDVTKTSETGLSSSVMDYNPVNIVPEGVTQGDFFCTTIGPYDHWAIEYGYTPIKAGSPEGELEELNKIAARSGEKELAYGTDEDARSIDPDPHCSRYDFGQDLVAYGQQQAKLVAQSWPGIVDATVEDGKSYERSRQAFGVLLGTHGRAMFAASRYIGGLNVSRSHKGDDNATPPFTVVPAVQQRGALELLEEEVFNDEPFSFPAELYNHMAASRWDHWGAGVPFRADYPAHETILMWQDRILQQLLSSLTLTRLHDSELKLDADEDALTTPELLERLTKSIFAEVDSTHNGEYTNRKPAISSLRRNLQRSYLQHLSQLALGRTAAPQDCQTVAFLELTRLQGRMDQLLAGDVDLDTYSQAHLQETSARITKVIDATMLATP
jgi:hypothetical protein